MDARSLARVYSLGRVAVGGALLAAPALATRGWIGDAADDPRTQVIVRALGIRDLLMGAVSLHTLSHPQVGPRWLMTCAVADAVDAGATLAAREHLSPAAAYGVGAFAGGAAVTGFALAAALRD